MSKNPWYKRYPSDFIAATVGMPLELKGAYSMCLDLIYDRNGKIPDDPQFIAGVCGCSVRKWNSLRARLVETGKLIETDGHLTNSRADKELEKTAKTTRKLAENGAKGGNKNAENKGQSSENNNVAQAGLKLSRARLEARSQILDKKEDAEDARARDAERLRESLCEEFGLDDSRNHGLVVASEIYGWLAAGATGHDISAGVRGVMARKSGDPPRAWAYFRQAVADARATREAGLPEGRVVPIHGYSFPDRMMEILNSKEA